MSGPTSHRRAANGVIASADSAAAAALRELPEALILVFDTELRFVMSAGSAVERVGDSAAFSEGSPLSDVFPAEVFDAIAPLLRSALTGETRSREIWTRSSGTA